MIIDIHVHTSEYSLGDSSLSIENAIIRAKSIGLDGICFTDHESLGIYDFAAELSARYDFLVIPGIEILTHEGDLLVFGMEELPTRKLHASELVSLVKQKGGAAISAHPFRDNKRGMGHHITRMDETIGIEVLNGRTVRENNAKAFRLALELGYPCLGGSDAHTEEEVGAFATLFPGKIRNLEDLIRSVNQNEVSPLIRQKGNYLALEEPVEENRRYLRSAHSLLYSFS